jgi:hypothetical protein
VTKLWTMYKALTSDKAIDPDKFQELCDSWKRLYFEDESDVNWYKICPSVHRILEHAADTMRVLPVPVGLTTEECTEVECFLIEKFIEFIEFIEKLLSINSINEFEIFLRPTTKTSENQS